MKRIRKERHRCLYRLLAIMAFLSVMSPSVFAQERTITGTVTDEAGLTIPGATVLLQGTTIGTITDIDGNYSIVLTNQKDPVLEFSFIGLKSQIINVADQSVINVTLGADVNDIEEVVVVGYGTQKRISVTGAVNTLKADELNSASSSSLAASLTGKMPGTVVVQGSGVAGANATSIRIRGAEGNPLILVDGVERSFQDIDPDEIESITTLKDASATAVYGIRGGDGVIIITTKRGKEGPAKISVKAEYGFIEAGKRLEMLDAYEYASMYNEGAINDNSAELEDLNGDGTITPDEYPYTPDDLELFRNGQDPIFHPNNSWYDDLTDDFGYRQRYTVNISGGHQKMRYYTSIGYMRERDIYKDFNVGYDDRSYYRRYNLRTNLDIDVTSTTVLSVNLAGQFANRHKPNMDFGDLTYTMFRTPPTVASLREGRIIKNDQGFSDTTPIEKIYNNGYQDNHTNQMQFSIKLKQNLDFITKGLGADVSFSYDHGFTNNYTASKNIPKYVPYEEEDGSVRYERIGSEGKLGSKRETKTKPRDFVIRTKLNYKRNFGRHNVGAVGVFTASEEAFLTSGGNPLYVPRKYLEVAGRFSYNFDDRYFVEFNAGYNGSETFAEENRFGFFPAISGGWVITSEEFFPKNDILTFLKVRGSYGTTGNDKGDKRFLYFDTYDISYSGGYNFGITPSGQGEAKQTKVGNPDVQWSTSHQSNFAVEAKFFNSKLHLQGDWFKTKIEDKLRDVESGIPTIVGESELPAANFEDKEIWGHEFQIKYNHKFGKLDWDIFANYSFADKKIVDIREQKPPAPWQAKTGKHPDNVLGYDAVGFYTQDDIDYLAANGGLGDENVVGVDNYTPQAGDLKYRDLDGDYMITVMDMKTFENVTSPKKSFGFGTGFKYKGFSLDLFFQGVRDVTYVMKNRVRIPFFSGTNSGASYITKRWTPERFANGEEILYPRMSISGKNTDHNHLSSDFWFRDASYIRLKNAELAYKFKGSKLKEIGISSLRVYMSGTNLLTWTDLDLVDPETKAGDNTPIGPNKVYTLGVNVSF